MSRYRTIGLVALIIAVITVSVPAQESDAETQDAATTETTTPESGTSADNPFQFGVGITLGVTSFENDDGEVETFQLLGLRPEFSYGQLGLGLDLPVHYRFTGGDGDEFEVRNEDWVPDENRSFLDVYLPKFRYIRYGSAEDELYARFGGFSSATLGSGFIMNSYSNELFLPNRRIFGGIVAVDGGAFGAPYAGIEAIVGNVAAWDVIGGRAYVRPLVTTNVPLLSQLEIGSSVVTDRDPFFYLTRDPFSPYSDDYEGTDPPPLDAPSEDVAVWGLDVRQPILNSNVITLDLLGDMAFQEQRRGGMGGFTGRLAGFVLYGGQLRVVDDNFVPRYFDSSYDLRRGERYAIYDKQFDIPGGVGWLGRLGVAIFNDGLVFDTNVSGSFNPQPGSYPEIRSTLTLEEGLVPVFSGFSFQGSYTKFDLRRWDDLTDAENAIIGARFNIRSGAVVISLLYDLTYDPYNPDEPWVVTSGLESTISF